eukprot:TRINITY_DN20190_c0_g1_i1.p1 TRINITY_DN20190_c0_g1~~TRINITY_DN20190_c0_g1_i1.p1  ORF type:complete len:469 (-),score=33.02 TRINITY_DN20190_c0_g1_i1:242-1648(-)
MTSHLEVDALIVGGGPVGLALGIGLHQRGLKVCIVEKSREVDNWNRAYSYRVDCRGIGCLERLGLGKELKALGVASEGFARLEWNPDGSFVPRTSNTAISLGYWLQRPALLKMLEAALPEGVLLHGELKCLELQDEAIARLDLQGRETTVKARLVFGCDGVKSAVRETMLSKLRDLGYAAAESPEDMVKSIDTPSSGMGYRAVLYRPPESLKPDGMHLIKGKSGRCLSLLPFCGKAGEPRPLSFALPLAHRFHSYLTPEEVLADLGEDFPQLEVQERLTMESAKAWCDFQPTVFPRARWCLKAAVSHNGYGCAILGDALHSFPPDLGQGVNAGFEDVTALLNLLTEKPSLSDAEALKTILSEYDKTQRAEAEAICQLLPIGMPYQYRQPFQLSKISFFAGFLVRMLAWKLVPSLISPPVVFLVTQAPPVRYSEILRLHRQNTRRLCSMAAVLSLLCAMLCNAVWQKST